MEIGRRMGKYAATVRAAVRNNKMKEKFIGKWSKNEVALLEEAIRAQVGDDLEDISKVCWKKVASHVGTRTVAQCKHRWYVTQRMRPAKEKKLRHKWNDNNSVHLIHVLYHKKFSSDFHVDWKTLLNEEFPWASSPQYLRRAWRNVVDHVPRHVPPDYKERIKFLYHTFIPILLTKKGSTKTLEDAIMLSKVNTVDPNRKKTSV
ncbi:uncharacterized protein ISCGN_027381 [Ixodes scapularis]